VLGGSERESGRALGRSLIIQCDDQAQLPASRFDELVGMILDRFGRVYIIQPYREKEVCAPACMNAEGFECQCSCLGANHGAANSRGWFEVSETFAVRYGERKWACLLLTRSNK
jgi:hypothetical protein